MNSMSSIGRLEAEISPISSRVFHLRTDELLQAINDTQYKLESVEAEKKQTYEVNRTLSRDFK